MTAEAISIFPVPEIDSIEADIRERILAVQEKAGFVPNIFLALAARPGLARKPLAALAAARPGRRAVCNH